MRVWQVVDVATSPMVRVLRKVVAKDLTLGEATTLAKSEPSWKVRPIFEFD